MKIYLKTFGCQMNEYDSEIIKSILSENGFSFADNEMDADVILLNTCAVRENAQRKVFGLIHDIRHRRGGRPAIYGVLGCIATYLKEGLLENKNLNIDLIVGPDSYRRLPQIINECLLSHQSPVTSHQKKTHDITLNEFEMYSDITPLRDGGNPAASPQVDVSLSRNINAWIAVMRGCNNFCTFCVVPYTRGRERSRSPQDIVKEAKKAAEEGMKQVTLLGQNVNSYRFEDAGFSDLLEAVSQVEGIERIRFISPHPKDFPLKLLETMAKNKKVCKHIHFPLQSGNNRILELMNRTYTKERFLELVEKMKKMIPEIVITTDIIVGFPTETDDEFEDTVDVMKQVAFDSAFIFKYSERKGTMAAKKFKDDVPQEKKKDRIIKLNTLQKEISLKKNEAHIGQVHDVLIEQKGTSRSANAFQGRNDGNKIVILPEGSFCVGQIIPVKITSATPHVLRGQPVEK